MPKPPPKPPELLDVIRRYEPVEAKVLQSHFGVSQPTLSRWLKALGDSVCQMGRTRG
ncbi:hypothetical protein EJ065_6551 [Corallococcus coralloides]|uniref:Transposase n=1 Tax=Corallococcus coralloides TaxID=184914 RepID=A0A410S1J4_CORCK|nr:hypothetical protein [Corallococcus coralloides]QAT88079.1 hypothetical protein EJ065_6551 [Corallococcus coralloides]